jgi:alkanesulfonate monooxygenase SsuD/methylene tetrahydromethanopterin reductase-like flavin-dependent oxidoreductase (luciferase family)
VPYRGYTLKELTLVPRPKKLPVECWQPIQSGSARALDFIAKHGIQGVIGGGSAEGGATDKIMREWQATHERIGLNLELGERMAIGFQFHIAKSKEDGMKEAAKYYEENMKMFGELRLVKALTDEQIEAMRDPRLVPNVKLPRIEDAVRAGGFLTGTPDDIIEQLKAVEERYPGLARVTVAQPLGLPLSLCLEQLEWFAKDVMPAFKTA